MLYNLSSYMLHILCHCPPLCQLKPCVFICIMNIFVRWIKTYAATEAKTMRKIIVFILMEYPVQSKTQTKKTALGLQVINSMRQCQIRVRFESRVSQFFKALGKRFWLAKYVPIIIICCIEKGFYKRFNWSPVLGVFTNALITWQCKCLC